MDAAARRYAEHNVPRYTSYPTAADFTPLVTAKDHAGCLRRLGGEGLSLYLHVPYCREICLYCGCNTKMAIRDEVIDGYRQALESEIAMVGRILASRPCVRRLHWGGGTPSILGAAGLRSVIASLHDSFTFEPKMEHAIELDPRYVTVELASVLAALGITRASLGVQDIDPLVQAAIGRLQPLGMVETAVRRLRSAGIRELSFDLMYGLPMQTVESIRRTCASVISLSPGRIACFGYAHLPSRKANQRRINESKLPSRDGRADQAAAIAEELVAGGYLRIGIDHFARPNDALARAMASKRLHRNFQGYTDDDSQVLLGFGASAISSFPEAIAQNISDVPGYVRLINNGTLASARGVRLNAEDQQRARIIERLMCEFEADLESLAPNTDFREEFSALGPMIRDGLVIIDGAKLVVTEAGRPVVRVIAATFDTARRSRSAQFSVAV